MHVMEDGKTKSKSNTKDDKLHVDEKPNGREEGRYYIPARYILTFMSFLGFFNVYCLRANLSVAIVSMVNSTTKENASVTEECPEPTKANNTNSTSTTSVPQLPQYLNYLIGWEQIKKTGEFDWDEKTQGLILGAFYYGYVVTQIPGGWLAGRIGGRRLFGYGLLCTSVLTLVTPLAARAGVGVVVAVRVLEGIGEAVAFPAMHSMWGVWSPVYERSKSVAFSYGGAQVGTVFALPISGILCQDGFAGGWPSVFYVFGALGCLWFIGWMVLISETPATHPWISDKERSYIESNLGVKAETVNIPWKSIFTCKALWGTAAGHFAFNWGSFSMLTCLPTYMKNILHYDVKEEGFLSALPSVMLWVTQIFAGYLADYLRGNGYLTTVVTRKIFYPLGAVIAMGLLIGTYFVGCNHTLAVILLTLAVGFSGFSTAGHNPNHLDIAPRFAGLLYGITNTVASVPGFLGPEIVGVLTNNNQTSGQWHIFFFLTAAVYGAGALLFCLLAEGEEQEWARAPPSATSAPTQEKEVALDETTATPQEKTVTSEEKTVTSHEKSTRL